MKTRHPFAELMLEYAQDAMNNLEPWTLWEWKIKGGDWVNLKTHPNWNLDFEFRKKQELELPKGATEAPEVGTKFWTVNHSNPGNPFQWKWNNTNSNFNMLELGSVYLNKEDAILCGEILAKGE